jgi:hypothetical protein
LDTVSDNYLYDILELPNGDIAAVGWAGASTISPLQQTWLLKVDSNGCFGPGNCPPNLITGVNDYVSSSGVENQISVYPNPFKDELNVKFTTINEVKESFTLELIDASTGRLMLKQSLNINSNTVINTTGISNGVFILHLVGTENTNRYIKLVKLN